MFRNTEKELLEVPVNRDNTERTAESEPRDGMQSSYVVLSDEERQRGFQRQVVLTYKHVVCGAVTRMGRQIAETYARDPGFYGSTYCVGCKTHKPVGQGGEFVWVGEDGRHLWRTSEAGDAIPWKVGT